MPQESHITRLIIKHLQETITADETLDLQQWIAEDEQNRRQFEALTTNETLRNELLAYSESEQRIKAQVYAQLPEVQNVLNAPPKRIWMRYASVAAAILVLVVTSIWYWLPKEAAKTTTTTEQTPVAANIPAGGNKATLTLADGTVIDLDKAANGEIAKQGKSSVTKREDGQLEYQSVPKAFGSNRESSITYNVLSTPRGGQYQLLLPDGSKVWLNAASSIKYPTAFSGSERRVEVTGETYFEITKNPGKPFKVNILPSAEGGGRGGEILVTGTSFNVNAYGDEQPIVATLLEGKITISEIAIMGTQSGGSAVNNHKPQTTNHKQLLPGEEAQIKDKAGIVIRKNVDTESAVAWMKGFFDFHNAGIKTVMKQVSRWYNVDVQYTGAVPAQTFEGSLDRNIPLNELLASLQQMGTTKFQIEGRTIKVK
ncbi:FecR family protein [Niastella caeni]|nr:FecR family protein [Niastella caeni]